MPKNNLGVIIPVAGLNRYIKHNYPKCLIPIGGEFLILRQIRVLRQVYPHCDITVVGGNEADRVFSVLPQGVKFVENERHDSTNVVRSISMGLKVADNSSILIVYGDLVFNEEAISWISAKFSGILVDSRGQIEDEEVGVVMGQSHVKNLSYGLKPKWGQICHLCGRELSIFKEYVFTRSKEKTFGFEALNAVIERGGQLRGVEPKGLLISELDHARDIEIANRRFPIEGSVQKIPFPV